MYPCLVGVWPLVTCISTDLVLCRVLLLRACIQRPGMLLPKLEQKTSVPLVVLTPDGVPCMCADMCITQSALLCSFTHKSS